MVAVVSTVPLTRRATAAIDDAVLVAQQIRGVHRYLRLLGADGATADDLTQEAFLVAWSKHKQLLPTAALRVYLRQTALNLWLNRQRKRRREALAIAACMERLWIGECADDGDALVARIRLCVARLAPRARHALVLTYVDERPRSEVATSLGLRDNGLKMLLQRARAAVAACWRALQSGVTPDPER
jgi:RNA polymerase sigma factor (sigma-70 family)